MLENSVPVIDDLADFVSWTAHGRNPNVKWDPIFWKQQEGHFPEGNILPARKRAGAAWHLGMFLVVGLKAFEIETLYDIEDSITDLEKRT